ncbi:hypothetical protein A4R63_07110 [Corynebacterium pseudotuberculosis]|uniref:DUF3040 domain-containing protein n=1 Tax=Corynebacterium pseudotuberculosis TaxID=1719 RepID=UPI00025922B7|nr:DUF3040 domain-containing protein [Corynebacterium pseudotuberculosis]AFH91229.1 DUF3040 domain-containing protein [Corynebacterium pseudotuberculosis 31]APB11265.1 hypothetical protein A4R72_07340 [Corynebacterium pseudotuberculosis]APB13308.1 hypothetical protein A4R71_07355 [Corynebacterium pseudotuberculosis]APB15353.1 hypothetical protein A4R68_07350 [Corynebacterium pseudotuberculosis]APB17398.1 hypothetical protein A4R67_07325 [Corynebacterium pseudotuberculosis]
MSLSEQEQRALREIERSLLAEDPKFGASVRDAGLVPSGGMVTLRGIAIIVIGLVMLVGGVALSQQTLLLVILAIAGFIVMLGGAIWMLRAPSYGKASAFGAARSSGKANRNPRSDGIGNRMEENFRRRFEQ